MHVSWLEILCAHIRARAMLLIECEHAQNGRTALINAAVHGRSYCVRLLLDAGADIFASDNVRFDRCTTAL